MAKGIIEISFHGLIVAGAIAFAMWAAGVNASAARYDTATPYTPPSLKYKYIPLHSSDTNEESLASTDESEESGWGSRMPISEVILTVFRTALDVVRKVNKNRSSIPLLPSKANSTAVQLHRSSVKNETSHSGRGFEDYYDEHHYHDHDHHETTTVKPMKQGRYDDPWAGYYDWIINEGSFKFWSVFQLFTVAVLLYACLSAIYYAKFNPIIPDYSMEYDDYFLQRTVGRSARSLDSSEMPSGLSWINPTTFQFILDAISKHYEEE